VVAFGDVTVADPDSTWTPCGKAKAMEKDNKLMPKDNMKNLKHLRMALLRGMPDMLHFAFTFPQCKYTICEGLKTMANVNKSLEYKGLRLCRNLVMYWGKQKIVGGYRLCVLEHTRMKSSLKNTDKM